ncbi:hypothetical protein [Tissierella sp. Yu-01]|uniref:hypothetical protein n=1 Tax=Tissierella sp. Yu-01 TaxID=3035694 RepID=UPI00240E968E|nr:hypothetical protein [Tissierella sp. Yu-01]WFA09580.1 hypothetical protein P3962_03230 [Tissierella sp. Yu-01]
MKKTILFLIIILILVSNSTLLYAEEEIDKVEIKTETSEVYLARIYDFRTFDYNMFEEDKDVSYGDLILEGNNDFYVPDSNHVEIEYPKELFKGQAIYVRVHQAILEGDEHYTTTINFDSEVEIKELGQMKKNTIHIDGEQVGEFGSSSMIEEFEFNLFNISEYTQDNSLIFENGVGYNHDYYFAVYPKGESLTIDVKITGQGEERTLNKTLNIIDEDADFSYEIIDGQIHASVYILDKDMSGVVEKPEKDKILSLARKYGYNSSLQPSITFETDLNLEKTGTYSLDLYGETIVNKIIDKNFFENLSGGSIRLNAKNRHVTFFDIDNFNHEVQDELDFYQITVGIGGKLFEDFDFTYYYPDNYIPDEPETSEDPETPKSSIDPKNSKTPNEYNPNDKPKEYNKRKITKKLIITISIITLLIVIGFKVPFIPFTPLFYYTRKVAIYSNLKQEDGTIKRKKVFSEGYEISGTQLIVDITDTMSIYKEYNYLEIEIPKDIAHSVITKVIENKKVKEITPRTLIIKHKNHKEPIQIVPIAENFYDEKKNTYVIKLNV